MIIAFCIGSLIGIILGAASICLLAMWIGATHSVGTRSPVYQDWESWMVDDIKR